MAAVGSAALFVTGTAMADGPIGPIGGGPFGPGPVVSHLTTVTKECASGSYRYTECSFPGEVVLVELEHQLSSARCTLDRTFGFRGNVLWVNAGCRGRFKVSYIDASPDESTDTINIACSSSRYRYAECATPGPIVALEVVRRDSGAACTRDRSFGFRGDKIWVNHGCRAEFKVTYALPPVITPWP